MRAIKLTADYYIEVIDIEEPKMESIRNAVGGYAEVVRPAGLYQLLIPGQINLCMVVNEDGHRLNLEFNVAASVLYNYDSDFDSCIVGDVLILGQEFRDDALDFIGLSEEQERYTHSKLAYIFDFLKVR